MNIKFKFIVLTMIFVIFTNSYICSYAAQQSCENLEFIVILDNNTIDNNIKLLINNNGGQVIKELDKIGVLEIRCNSKLKSEIQNRKEVKKVLDAKTLKSNDFNKEKSNGYYIDNNTTYYMNSNSSYYEESLYNKYQWDVKKVTNNGASFYMQPGNHSVVVGIIDSGVDTDHPDLKRNFWGGKNCVPKKFNGDNTETGDIDDIEDRYGHGTCVSGQIAANGQLKGVAPNIGFKSYRIFNKNGETTASICADAIISAVDDGIKVINLCFGVYYLKGKCTWVNPETHLYVNLGDDSEDYEVIKRAVEYAYNKNVIVITSAGNEGVDCSNSSNMIEYMNSLYMDDGYQYLGTMQEIPGGLKEVINVSSSNKSDDIASYSNFGEEFIGVCAPGGDDENKCITTDMNGKYTFVKGTSFSAPKVAAEAALIICNNKNISLDEIKKKIYDTADKKESTENFGAGIINVYRALK